MLLNKFSKISGDDLIKFIVYSIIFFLLFFAYNLAQSPAGIIEYNSAPNTDNLYLGGTGEVFNLGQKKIIKPVLTISFIPEDMNVNKNLLKMLKININSAYFKEKVTPLYLVIDGQKIDPRGQISGNKLILSSKIDNDSETIKVFVHELGHIVNLYYLNNKKPALLEKFYNISWLDYNIKKKDAKIVDFVSGYALSNKYEDFAESFVFYIFHNEEFQKRTDSNNFLKQKYNFFKNYIFNNSEFFSTSFAKEAIQAYNWDSTKISINLKKYLYYIR